VVLGGELLDGLLVLVQLGEVGDGHAGDGEGLGFIAVLVGTENADRKVFTRDKGKGNGTSETLFLDGVVVLKTNLELDGLGEVALLLDGALQDGLESLGDNFARDFALYTL